MSARDEWGYFFVGGHLIGHDSADVYKWLEAHPDATARNINIYFSYGDGGDDTEVTELFFPEEDE